MKDKYDDAIAYLEKNPGEILDAWGFPSTHSAGCLFSYVGATNSRGDSCGCLTQVKSGDSPAKTARLTKAIRKDARIPERPQDIELKHLQVFAEWQRRIDKELKRS